MLYFIVYYHKFNSGGNESEFRLIGSYENRSDISNGFIEDIVDNIESEYNWSEHYSGIDYSVIPINEMDKEKLVEYNKTCGNNMSYYKNLYEETKKYI
jgi:hypothetical protein